MYGYVMNDPINLVDPPGAGPVPDCVRKIFKTKNYRKYFRNVDLDAVEVVPDDAVIHRLPSVAAMTPGGQTIYFDRDYYDTHSPEGIARIGHELVHVDQWSRDPYAFSDYLIYNATHPSAIFNPDLNPYENEAYTKENAIERQLIRDFGPGSSCGCK